MIACFDTLLSALHNVQVFYLLHLAPLLFLPVYQHLRRYHPHLGHPQALQGYPRPPQHHQVRRTCGQSRDLQSLVQGPAV